MMVMTNSAGGDPAFTPIQVGRQWVRNRLVMASTTSALGDHTGAATQRNAAYYERRARGGVGMIVTEGIQVHPSSNIGYNMLRAGEDRFVSPLARIAAAVQPHGTRLIGQIMHAGR